MIDSKQSIVGGRDNRIVGEVHNHKMEQRLEAKELADIRDSITGSIELHKRGNTLQHIICNKRATDNTLTGDWEGGQPLDLLVMKWNCLKS